MAWSPRSRLIALICAGILLITAAAAVQPVRIYFERRYLDAALAVIERNSVRAGAADWVPIRRRAQERVASVASRSDTYEIRRICLSRWSACCVEL